MERWITLLSIYYVMYSFICHKQETMRYKALGDQVSWAGTISFCPDSILHKDFLGPAILIEQVSQLYVNYCDFLSLSRNRLNQTLAIGTSHQLF